MPAVTECTNRAVPALDFTRNCTGQRRKWCAMVSLFLHDTIISGPRKTKSRSSKGEEGAV